MTLSIRAKILLFIASPLLLIYAAQQIYELSVFNESERRGVEKRMTQLTSHAASDPEIDRGESGHRQRDRPQPKERMKRFQKLSQLPWTKLPILILELSQVT